MCYTPKNDEFENVKNAYNSCRENERNIISEFLKRNNFAVTSAPNSGKGSAKYKSAKYEINPFDLSNWKWVEATDNEKGITYIVSLQCFNQDQSTKNIHVLVDRLGIYAHNSSDYCSKNAFEFMIDTGIDLPMDDNKLQHLLDLLSSNLLSKIKQRSL